MSVIDSFRRLGIEPTRDKHQIRKAYAAMASQCHPSVIQRQIRRNGRFYMMPIKMHWNMQKDRL